MSLNLMRSSASNQLRNNTCKYLSQEAKKQSTYLGVCKIHKLGYG